MIYAHHISQEKINAYLDELEKQQQEKDRIHNLTEQLMGKTKLKLKLQNQETKREQQFNKKLQEMKKLSTFVDAKPLINRLNLLNNRQLLIKLHVIKKTQQYYESTHKLGGGQQSNKIKSDLEVQPLEMDEDLKLQFLSSQNYEPLQRKEQSEKKEYSQPPITKEIQGADDIFNFDTTSKDDTNIFYQSIFRTSPSPQKKQLIQEFEEETFKVKQFLQSQGLIESQSKSSKQLKRIPLRKIPIQEYYKNFQRQCSNLVKDCKLESKRRSVLGSVDEAEESSQKEKGKNVIRQTKEGFNICNSASLSRTQTKLHRSQTNTSSSPLQRQRTFTRRNDQSGAQTQRTQGYNKSVYESQTTPLIARLQTQFESFTHAVNGIEESFKKINRGNKRIFTKMSSAVNSMHSKYASQLFDC